jgi:hypothetical protein
MSTGGPNEPVAFNSGISAFCSPGLAGGGAAGVGPAAPVAPPGLGAAG